MPRFRFTPPTSGLEQRSWSPQTFRFVSGQDFNLTQREEPRRLQLDRVTGNIEEEVTRTESRPLSGGMIRRDNSRGWIGSLWLEAEQANLVEQFQPVETQIRFIRDVDRHLVEKRVDRRAQ